ncbi:cbb3-type cytochrome oxidase assembly protein CcoS [Ponticoccus alexandrii]|uniref:Cbb3-type cytochrome oxidase assembly protein CcoS n=1 Tax=Ponticoccus alexandrii TaxID=1943633 RepID=A0ABX7F5F6_9RHOB|nr:cbb3-type cytochrome oxidase assembly protein CcoS [Ponticoccus alexandrii]ETA50152.1 hypothetical protein P279_21090 [Rhodobacteraceae bacterium PD-2]QRF65766.1 cbb3-type cytochrome oxidase assembly protein CcoS [Ponticoccus alexandrii]
MNILVLPIPVTLMMGAIGLVAFFWTARTDQFSDPEGDARRILLTEDHPLPSSHRANREGVRRCGG